MGTVIPPLLGSTRMGQWETFTWVQNNLEWIFSGAGITVLTMLGFTCRWLLKKWHGYKSTTNANEFSQLSIISYTVGNRNDVGIFTICNTSGVEAKDVIFRFESDREYAYLDLGEYHTEDLKGIKITKLYPNTQFDIRVAFSGGPPTVNTRYSWENPDGSRQEKCQLVSLRYS